MADKASFSGFLKIRLTIICCLVSVLAACAGGGSGDADPIPTSTPTLIPTAVPTIVPTAAPTLDPTAAPTPTPTLDPTPEPDREPDAISFTPLTGVERGSEQTSDVATITGIDAGTPLSITGGTYQLNGTGDFVNAETTVNSDTSMQLRTNASANFSETVTVTLTVGTSTFEFLVTTEDQDLEPDALVFTAAEDQEPGATNIESNMLTIVGINDIVTLNVTNGEYSLNGAGFTADEGTAQLNDTITLRGNAANSVSTDETVTLNIGTGSATFVIGTFADVTPPTVEIEFPPELSFTNGTSTFVRGTAEDDYSEISRITIVVDGVSYEAMDTSSEDEPAFSTWQVEQDISSPNRPALIEGENIVIVQAEDSSLNVAEDADSVRVFQNVTDLNFPDANVSWGRISAIELDPDNNRLFALASNGLFSIDLADSTRSLVSDDSFEDQNVRFAERGILLDSVNNRLISVSATTPGFLSLSAVLFVDISDSDSFGLKTSLVNQVSFLASSSFIIFNPNDNDELLFADGERVTRSNVVNLDTGVFSGAEFSGDLLPNDDNPFGFIVGIVFDEQNNRLLVSDRDLATIFTVDPTTRERGILSRFNGVPVETDTPNSDGPAFESPRGIDIDNDRNRLIVSNFDGENIVGVDLENGARTEISGPEVPNNLNNFNNVTDVYVDSSKSFFYVVSSSSDNDSTIYAVDHLTGERVIISRASLND